MSAKTASAAPSTLQLRTKLLKRLKLRNARRQKLGRDVTFKFATEPQPADTEAARQRRLQAIGLIAGLWANRPDASKDGLTLQEELRSEWYGTPLKIRPKQQKK